MSFNNQDENREDLRKNKITKELSRTLKALQAQQLFDEPVYSNELSNKLCDILESIFLHGLKEPVAHKLRMFMQQSSGQVSTLNFWKFVSRFTHKNVISQIHELKQIKTDVGYCRVWVRMALNDGLLCSYIDAMTADHSTLESFYYQLAYLRDLEQPGIFKSYVQGLMAFQFELPYNSSVLNSWMNTPLLLAGIEGAVVPDEEEEEPPKNVGTNTDTTDETTDTADLTSSTLTPGADSSISTNPFTASTISTAESDENTLTMLDDDDDADVTRKDNSTEKDPKAFENSQQNLETPTEPPKTNNVESNLESSCTILSETSALGISEADNTTKIETNSVLTNNEKIHHPTEVEKDPKVFENSQQNLETPTEPPKTNVESNLESSCTVLSETLALGISEDSHADNTTKIETNSVLTNNEKIHHPTEVEKDPKAFANRQQNLETPTGPPKTNTVESNPESCTILNATSALRISEDSKADNTTKIETNSVLTNSEKIHHPTEVGKAPHNNNNNKTSRESKSKSGNIQCQQPLQRPKTLNIGNSPGANSLNLGNSLEIASGWSSVFLEDPVPINAPLSEPFTEPAEIVVVQDAENFESLVGNYTREHTLSPIPFGEIADNSPEHKNGHTQDRSEKDDVKISKRCKEIYTRKESIVYYADFEVLNSTSYLAMDPDSQTRIGNLMQICNEKGIASQNYQCKSCPSPLGLLYGKPLVCTYDGGYYCTDCHRNDEFYIPSRIIFNWDFSKHKVCVKNFEFLKEIQEYPLIDIDKVNPELYDYISDMRDTKLLRIRLAHLSSYLFTCKKSVAEKFRQSLWPKEYLYEDIHLYSLIDFLQIQSGQLQTMLKKSLKTASKHVYECGLCSQKGFICEICKNQQVIYPFEMDTTHRCEQCKAVYHKTCMNLKDQCPKCERRRQRFMKIGPVSTSPEPDYDVIPWDST